MSISFNQVPANLRVPFVYVEFDNSNAVQGPQLQPYKGILIGQKLAAGTITALTPTLITSADQAAVLAGAGSMLHNMAQAWFASNQYTPIYIIAFDDPGAGVAATNTITITGTPTAAGTLTTYIAGRRVQSAVALAASVTVIAAALAAAINADTSMPVTAAAAAGVVTLTNKHKGLHGNDLDVRLNYNGETTPAGVVATIVLPVNGSGVPVFAPLFAAMGDEFYNVWVNPYTDTASLADINVELQSRAGPLRQIDAVAFGAKKGTVGALSTFGSGLNSQFLTIMATQNSPTPTWEYAAEYGALAASYLQRDPARPLQTLQFSWIKAPKITDRFTNQERNLLLFDGIATSRTTPDGFVAIERTVTTYQKNSFGADDTSYLDVETIFTLSYLRYDFRNAILRKYPRHKLANDGTKFGDGQAIVTPNVIRVECVNKFREWESIGLVEGVDQFKRDLIVERNISDPNRLDVVLPPDLVNQFRVMGVKLSFILQSVEL